MKRNLTPVVVLLLFGVACSLGAPPASPTQTAKPSLLPTIQSLPSPTGQNPCGDGVCGPAEQADPNLCPVDCAGTTPLPLATAEPVASSTPTQTTEALPDELVFIPDPGIRIEMASQPAPVVAEDGTIYVLYAANSALPNEPSSSAVAHSTDGLTFTELGLDPNSVSVINPFATLLPNGVWRLYDLDANTGVMTSRSSQDGIHFKPDDGERYITPAEHLPIGIRVFYVNSSGDVILLYVAPLGNNPDHHIRRAVSSDGGDTFTFHSDNVLGDQGDGVLHTHLDPKFVELPEGGVRLITMIQGNKPIPGQLDCCQIYSFTSADGYTFTQDPGVRLQTSDFTDITVWSLNDPWVILLPDGRYRMYVAALVMADDGTESEPFWVILSATTP